MCCGRARGGPDRQDADEWPRVARAGEGGTGYGPRALRYRESEGSTGVDQRSDRGCLVSAGGTPAPVLPRSLLRQVADIPDSPFARPARENFGTRHRRISATVGCDCFAVWPALVNPEGPAGLRSEASRAFAARAGHRPPASPRRWCRWGGLEFSFRGGSFSPISMPTPLILIPGLFFSGPTRKLLFNSSGPLPFSSVIAFPNCPRASR